jgi:hypothetical protein
MHWLGGSLAWFLLRFQRSGKNLGYAVALITRAFIRSLTLLSVLRRSLDPLKPLCSGQ